MTTGDIHITVNGGSTTEETVEAIRNGIGEWFRQAVGQLGGNNSPTTNVSPQLGGAR